MCHKRDWGGSINLYDLEEKSEVGCILNLAGFFLGSSQHHGGKLRSGFKRL